VNHVFMIFARITAGK